MTCPHVELAVSTAVWRLTDGDPPQGEIPPAAGFMVDVTAVCRDCDRPFEWVGPMMTGVSHDGPATSPDRTELRLPLRPSGGN